MAHNKQYPPSQDKDWITLSLTPIMTYRNLFCSMLSFLITYGDTKIFLLMVVLNLSIQELVTIISKQAKTHWLSMVQSIQSGSSTNHTWKPSPSGWMKINVDAAYKDDSACTGVNLRNVDGSVHLAATYSHQFTDALTAEALAILDAVNILISIKAKHVIIEADCINVVSFINGSSNNFFWTASPVVEKIKRAWNCWPS
ncbi:hypothetical protein CASFOL_034185 [Castilleja foliolosa]|uniref:RNase H type-1 domain-containing protein n=1 Tax=Castilleja foliolosa TaxID=1961234 RepID=A0ABD3BXG2_9LAMI